MSSVPLVAGISWVRAYRASPARIRSMVLAASGLARSPMRCPGDGPVDRGGGGQPCRLEDLVAACAVRAAVAVLGAVPAPRSAGLERLDRLHWPAGAAHSCWAQPLVQVGRHLPGPPSDDVEPVAGLRCRESASLGVHGVEIDDAVLVAE